MGEYFEHLVQRVGELPAPWAYAALALSAFLENVLPPVPGDTVVVFSAYLAGRGVLSWVPVYVVTCLGGTAGFLVMYAVGRSQGRGFLQGGGWRARIFPERRLQRASRWLQRYGAWLVLGNRFLTGVRSVIAISAGFGGMGWPTVAGLGMVSMLLWNGLLLYAGMALGENWDRVSELLARYNRGMAVMLAAVAAVAGLRLWLRRRSIIDNRRRSE